MKSGLILALSLTLFSGLASSTSIVEISLGNDILNSEAVITSQIISGKCLLTNCKESKPRVRYKEYEIRCLEAISGQCPPKSKFRSASELKIGATYIQLIFPDKDGLPAIFQSIELQNDNKEVAFKGARHRLSDITLYKRVSDSEPVTVNYYYRYSDFVSAVKSIKNDPRFKN
jgi:hypothetical protein